MTKNEIQQKALDSLIKFKNGTVSLSVGVGKTLVGLKHMDLHYTDSSFFLVVAPQKVIIQSWKDEAKKFNLDYLLDRITFTTYLSLNKQNLYYDAVYFDEAHRLSENHEEWLNSYKGLKIGLTGTPPTFLHSKRGRLFYTHIPVRYEYITDDAVSDHVLNNYEIIVHKLELNNAKTFKTGKHPKTWLTSEQLSYDYWTNRVEKAKGNKEKQISGIMRMKQLMSFPSKEKYAKSLLNKMTEKTILFANTQEQADNFEIASYHSNNLNSEKNLQDFKSDKITKLACVLQLNEGVNIPNLRSGIMLHCYSGSSNKGKQRFGRLLRLNPKDKCTLHILVYQNTIDEIWTKQVLSYFNQDKIKWINNI